MVKIGVVGVGKWGINHLKSLKDIRCDLVGISDVDPKKRDIAKQYGVGFFDDYHKILDEVDAVTITTPTDTHYKIVYDCLKAGKHVLVEKPIAESSKLGCKLVDFAKSKGLVLSVGYIYRFNNAVLRLKKILPEIGRIQYITSRYVHSTKPPRKDSGVILNLGIHVVDILNFTTDCVPKSLYASKKNLLSSVFEDSAFVQLEYGDFFAAIELSCMHPEKARDIWVVGERETVYVDFFSQVLKRFPLKVTYDGVDRKDMVEEKIVINDPLRDELKYFVDLVGKNNVDLDSNVGKENYYTTRICELCLESAEKKREVVVK
ncbi:MAG: Gfo/Idh/MocA family oxidoreductase [Candidatus Thermoplasmatota archaeon]|jgi:UDP-N-acetylglucosamine 3-dehydrogenase|nr:Gfo/Idh/MocA family oxidoreductase [Candidatus Thermoplasmatota archaeon]